MIWLEKWFGGVMVREKYGLERFMGDSREWLD